MIGIKLLLYMYKLYICVYMLFVFISAALSLAIPSSSFRLMGLVPNNGLIDQQVAAQDKLQLHTIYTSSTAMSLGA